ncbi:MAG: hypothetical protein NVV73_00065 [Cellvibrionaceae bacterium]|nr:hypothetical protein [Cellvibrionaceae bacterium]
MNGTARRASLDFLSRHAKQHPEFWPRPPGYRDVIRHIYSFGQAILDKMLAWSEDIDPNCFLIQNQPVLDEFFKSHRRAINYRFAFGQSGILSRIYAALYG